MGYSMSYLCIPENHLAANGIIPDPMQPFHAVHFFCAAWKGFAYECKLQRQKHFFVDTPLPCGL